jgi:vitamin B12 transporter
MRILWFAFLLFFISGASLAQDTILIDSSKIVQPSISRDSIPVIIRNYRPPQSTPYPTGDTPVKIIPEIRVTSFRLDKDKENLKTQGFYHSAIKTLALTSVADVLKSMTNVYVKEYGSGLASPSIRGTGAGHTQVYWNGIPVNSSTLGQSDLSILNANLFDAMRLTYGSGSAYTSGALGGSIELLNSLRWTEHENTWFRKSYGSFGLDESALRFDLGKKNFGFAVNAIHTRSQNNFEYNDRTGMNVVKKELVNSDFEQYGLNSTIGWFKGKHELKGSFHISDGNRGLAPIIGVATQGERQLDETMMGIIDHQFHGAKWNNQIKIGGTKSRLVYSNPTIDLSSDNANKSLFVQNESQFVIKKTWTLLTQFTVRSERANSPNFEDKIVRNIASNNIRLKHKTLRHNYFINLRTELVDGVLNPLLPGLGGYIDLKLFKESKTFQNSLSRVRLKWNGARNYKMPSLNDLFWNPGGNPNLRPEIGYSVDAGLNVRMYVSKVKEDGEGYNRDHNIDITGFYSNISDWIIWTPNGQYWEPQNIKKVQNSGLEISYSVWRQISSDYEQHGLVQFNYALTNNRVTESTVENDAGLNKMLIFIPRHNLKYMLEYHYQSWAIIFTQAITSKVFIDAANESYMPYYAPSSLLLSKTFSKKGSESIKLSVKVNNLFNEEYQVMPNRAMPGINFRLMGEVKF